MNERYMFRGKRLVSPDDTLDAGAWTYGYYTKKVRCTKDGAIIKIDAIENIAKIDGAAYAIHHEIDATTLSQCTGLKDKNGSLIFEGDILRIDNSHKVSVVFADTFHGLRFCYTFPEYLSNRDRHQQICKADSKYSEVIGNVHDNPELLKEVQ